jgi:hypothetical protein
MDLHRLFRLAQDLAHAHGFTRRHGLWRDLIGVLPVRAVGDHNFDVVELRLARQSDLRPVIALRAGVPDAWIEAPPPLPDGWAECALEMGEGDPARDVTQIVYPEALCDPVHKTPRADAADRLAWWAMMAGHDIVDLATCDWALAKPPRLLRGMADALGDTLGAVADEATQAAPLRVAETVRDVLFGPPGMVLPIGNAVARAGYLRRAAAVVAPSLEAARRVNKLLEAPPVAGPALFVAKQEARAA